MMRDACIVAAGKFGDSYALFKNRDRNYSPNLKLVHEVRDGVEVAYLKDDKTGWIEGMNEHGIGIVNAALMVSRDESERDEVERTGKKLLDGDRILRGLLERTVPAAAKNIRTYKGGLKGHTIISDGKKTVYVEMPDSNDVEYDDVPVKKLFVRTNHGIEFPDAGYVEGPREKSSKSRQEEAEKVLAKVKSPDEVAPAILRARTDRWEPTEMVRDSKSDRKMRTTSQMVLDLTNKKLILYLFPDRVKYLGLDDRLPKDFEPKITIEVHEYEDLKEDTDAETKPVTKMKKKGGDSDAMFEELLHRTASTREASDPCSPTGISYAWIDPHGKLHETPNGHEAWAYTFIQGVPALRDAYTPRVMNLIDRVYKWSGPGASDVLLREGWIRVSNFLGIQVWNERAPTPQAWQALLGVFSRCVLKARGIDPFEEIVYVEEMGSGGRAELYTVGDFVERFGSKRESEAMFEKLMTRTAETHMTKEARELEAAWGMVHTASVYDPELSSLEDGMEALHSTLTVLSDHFGAMRALMLAGEHRRMGRITGMGVQAATVAYMSGAVTGQVQGMTGTYDVRIRVYPKRGHHCTCPDWEKNGKRVGPCKHVLALGFHWLGHKLTPAVEGMRTHFMGAVTASLLE